LTEQAATKPDAVVLVSGGMDSCVTAAMARVAGHRLAMLHAGYGQRTERRELEAFTAIADFYGVPEAARLVVRLEPLAAIGGSALTDVRIAVPERNSLEGAGSGRSGAGGPPIPVSYVPFRNTHLLAAAVSWAEVLGAGSVWIGAVAEDSSGYPDCRPEYYEAFRALVRVGTKPETRIEVVTPVIEMSKAEIVRRGIELGAPLHLTWSCYQNEQVACGACESCLLRLRAFQQAGRPDPIAYRARIER
jgi:7-cyano-7-deazaguanine synthase